MNTEQKHFQFSLNIPPNDFAAYYEGLATSVLARTCCGKKVKFPASVLRQFVTQNGIRGMFEMVVDKNDKFVSVHKISDDLA